MRERASGSETVRGSNEDQVCKWSRCERWTSTRRTITNLELDSVLVADDVYEARKPARHGRRLANTGVLMRSLKYTFSDAWPLILSRRQHRIEHLESLDRLVASISCFSELQHLGTFVLKKVRKTPHRTSSTRLVGPRLDSHTDGPI